MRLASGLLAIDIRLEPKVLYRLRRTAQGKGMPYRSFIHEILVKEMKKAG